jgi:glycosyltransferase involved in cell wall biosynthesis
MQYATEMISLSVILPTKEENENLKSLIPRIIEHLNGISGQVKNFEIIVVDDSNTLTQKELKKQKWNDRVTIHLRDSKNSTLSSAIRLGVNFAKYETVCWMDADGSMPPETIKLLLDKYKHNENVVIGSRFVEGGGFKGSKIDSFSVKAYIRTFRNLKKSNDLVSAVLLSRILNLILRKVLSQGVNDWTSGYVICSKIVAMNNLKIDGYGEYFIDFLCNCLKNNKKIEEIGYMCETRKFGKSKTGENLVELIITGLPYLKIAFLQFFKRD